MKFRPLHDRVVIRRIEGEEDKGRHHRSPTPPRRSPGGEVVAVGPEPRDGAASSSLSN